MNAERNPSFWDRLFWRVLMITEYMITEYFKSLLQAIDTQSMIIGLTIGIFIGLGIFYIGIALIYRRITPIELFEPESDTKWDRLFGRE